MSERKLREEVEGENEKKLGNQEWTNWYKAIVPESRLGGERRLSVGLDSLMTLPALPQGLPQPISGPSPGTSPPSSPTGTGPSGRRLSATGGRRQSGKLGEIVNFLRRETGKHYFYKPVVNFVAEETACVYEFQVGFSVYRSYRGFAGASRSRRHLCL